MEPDAAAAAALTPVFALFDLGRGLGFGLELEPAVDVARDALRLALAPTPLACDDDEDAAPPLVDIRDVPLEPLPWVAVVADEEACLVFLVLEGGAESTVTRFALDGAARPSPPPSMSAAASLIRALRLVITTAGAAANTTGGGALLDLVLLRGLSRAPDLATATVPSTLAFPAPAPAPAPAPLASRLRLEGLRALPLLLDDAPASSSPGAECGAEASVDEDGRFASLP